MSEHTHDTTEDRDVCSVCDEIICPDCGRIVDYVDDDYQHHDGASCFLHAGSA